MSAAPRRVLAGLTALAATAALVALSRAPYAMGAAEHALLRLSWSGRPERIERCRALSDAELAERPAHMRRRLECEGYAARYAVAVSAGARRLSLDTVTGGGFRGDRAIHMLREYRLAPGEHAIAVRVARVDSTPAMREEPEDDAPPAGMDPLDRARRERDERRRQREEALPAVLQLDTLLRLAPRGVVLITYDPVRRRLTTVTRDR